MRLFTDAEVCDGNIKLDHNNVVSYWLHISKQTGNIMTPSANISIPRRTVQWSLVKETLL